MYKAIEYFVDLQDNSYKYQPGDIFPRKGLEVSKERLAELSTANNRRGRAMIELVNDMPKPIIDTPKPVAAKESVDVKETKEEKPAEKPIEKPKRGRKKSAN